jgi:hypothetical protein
MTDQPTPQTGPAPTDYEAYQAGTAAALEAARQAPVEQPVVEPAAPAPVLEKTSAPTGREPGPKPDFLVVEHTLKAQTEEGELSLDLRLSIEELERFMEAQELEPIKIPRFIIDELLDEPTKRRLLGMKDGARAYAVVMRWAQEVGARLGASLGESAPSAASSTSTEPPSATTSGPASA